MESWDSFDGPGVGRHIAQLHLRQKAAQEAQTSLHRSAEESKISMKAVHHAIATQQDEVGKLEALREGLPHVIYMQ